MRSVRVAKVFKACVYTSLVILAAATVILLYWLYQTTNVLEFKQTPIPIRTIRPHPKDGGVVILHVDYCKGSNATGRVRTSFVSSSREIFLPVSYDKQPKQCVDTELPILIPKDLPPDKYRIKFRVEYNVNPLRHSVTEVTSAPFEVVE